MAAIDNSDTADDSPRKRRRSSSPSGSDPERNRSTAAPVKAGGPSIDELEDLSLELGGKWEELGGRLRFNQAAITGFDEDNRGLKKKAFKMLMAWKQREGSNATYKVLCDALCDKKVQCALLAEQFCCE